MPAMTDREMQVSALKREVARLEQELELARQRLQDEQDTVNALAALCAEYGYDVEREYLGDWLEGRLSQ